MFDGYNAYVSIGDELKLAQFTDTVRQVCMSYANNKFVKAADQGGEPTAGSDIGRQTSGLPVASG